MLFLSSINLAVHCNIKLANRISFNIRTTKNVCDFPHSLFHSLSNTTLDYFRAQRYRVTLNYNKLIQLLRFVFICCIYCNLIHGSVCLDASCPCDSGSVCHLFSVKFNGIALFYMLPKGSIWLNKLPVSSISFFKVPWGINGFNWFLPGLNRTMQNDRSANNSSR